MCACVPVLFMVRVSPEAEKKNTHYKHFVSVFPRHAIGSSDSGQSKVPEMPEEASLTCMRARASLWCNWCNGEGQGPAQPAPDIKAQMWTQHLGFLAADSVRFEDGGWILHWQHFVNRWIPLIVLPPKCFMLLGIWPATYCYAVVSSLWIHMTVNLSSRQRGCLKASHLPVWFYSQGSSGTEYNGPSLLFMFQLRLQRSTVYQSKLLKKKKRRRRIINFLYRFPSQIYLWKVVTASPLLRLDVLILFVLFPGCFESVSVTSWLIEPGQRTFFPLLWLLSDPVLSQIQLFF